MEKSIDDEIVEAIINKRYPQNPIILPTWFVQEVTKRQKRYLFETELEEMDANGLCHPLLRVESAFTYHRVLKRNRKGRPVDWSPTPITPTDNEEDVCKYFDNLPESQQEWQKAFAEHRVVPGSATNYKPWTRFDKRYGREYDQYITPYYHPLQALQAVEAMQMDVARLHFQERPETPEVAWEWVQNAWKRWDEHKNEFAADESWKRPFLLYLLIEDRYLPAIRGVINDADYSDSEDCNWDEWAEQFDPKAALEKSGLTLDEVKNLRWKIARECRRHDSNFHWFPLIRHMERREWERVEGKQRLAIDYYELNEMLGDFLHDLTGEPQPLPDDVLQIGNWKTNVYHFPFDQIDYKRGNALPSILRHYGLDPRRRVWIFVEGTTESQYIEQWFEDNGVHLSTSRVVVVSLESHSGLKNETFQQFARDARAQDAAVYVLVDNDGQRDERVKNLQEWIDKGFIERVFDTSELAPPDNLPIGGLIWEPCFEDHNFTFEEQANALRSMLAEKHSEENINSESFAAMIEEARTMSATGSSMKAIILLVTGRFKNRLLIDRQAFKFSKPNMGRALARMYSGADKPVNTLLSNIYHIASLETAVYRPGKQSGQSTEEHSEDEADA